MLKHYRQYVLLCVAFLLLGCQSAAPVQQSDTLSIIKQPLTRSETLLHTAVQLQIFHEGQEHVLDEAVAYIRQMEALLSTNQEGSDVFRINQAAGESPVVVHEATYTIIKKAQQMAQKSHGKFDMTIGAVTNLWQIGSANARKPSESELQAVLPLIDYRQVELNDSQRTVFLKKKGMVIELGGISKGYIADGVRQLFEQKGITTAIINLGGNVIVMGTSPASEEGWRVGVQDPDEMRGQVVGSQRVKDGTIVTSGIYERFLEHEGVKYHHIINPATGYPLNNELSAVTIFTKESMEADAYSTSMFLFGIRDGMAFIEQQEGVEAVFIDKDRGVHLTSGLQDSFELTNKEYHIVHE